MFLAKDKNPYPFTHPFTYIFLRSIEYLIFKRCEATSVCHICNLHLITKVKFILSSISNGLLF